MHRRKGPTVTCHMFFPHQNPLGWVLLHMITILSTSVIPTLGGVVSNMFLFFLTVFRGLKDMISISKSDCQIGLYIVGVSPRDFRRFRDGLWVLFAKHSCTGVCLTFTTFATLRMIWIFYTIRNLYSLLPSPSSPYIMQPKSPGFLEFTLLPLPPLHVWQWHLLQRTLCPQSNSQTCTFLKFEHYLKSSRIQWSFLVPFNWWWVAYNHPMGNI